MTRAWLHRSFILFLCWVLVLGQLACSRIQVAHEGYPGALPAAHHAEGGPTAGGGTGGMAPGSLALSDAVASRPSPFSDAAAVHFEAFRRKVDSTQGNHFDGSVLAQLFIDREGRWELVHRELAPAWTRTDLIPGRYLLEVVEIYDRGRTRQPNEDKVIVFTLEPQTTAQVTLITRQVPWGRVALVSLAVVILVGIVVYAVLAAELDLDAPDLSDVRPGRIVHGVRGDFSLPPPPRGAPPPRLPLLLGGHRGPVIQLYTPIEFLIDMTEYVLVTCNGHCQGGAAEPEILAVSHFELPAPSYADGRVRVTFTAPVDSRYVSPSTLVVLDAQGKPVPGGIYLEGNDSQAVFHPLRVLTPGTYRVLVMTDQVVSKAGVAGKQRYEQYFTIAGPAVETPEAAAP